MADTIHPIISGEPERIVQALQSQLDEHSHQHARRAGWTRRITPTGLAALDQTLPHGGIPNGTITELLASGSGIGAISMAFRIAHQITQKAHVDSGARAVVVADTSQDFYPPAVQAYGITLDRLIVIRPPSDEDAFWATDQALRCSGVSVVLLSAHDLDDRQSRRLQLAAQSSGCTGIVLRWARKNAKSFAAVQWLVEGLRRRMPDHHASTSPDDAYPCRITLLKVLEGMPADPVVVDLHHETGAWPVHSVPGDRSFAKRA